MTTGLLLCRTGDDAGLAHLVGEGDCLVGRGPQCALCLPLPDVAERHALLRGVPGRDLVVEDLGSRDGTSVNGERVTPGAARPLRHLDVLALGGAVQFVFLELERVPTAELLAAALVGPAGDRVPLRIGDNVLGADEACDLIVADGSAAPRHALLRLSAHGLHVTRLATDRELRLRGESVEQAEAEDGDSLWLSPTAEFELELIRGLHEIASPAAGAAAQATARSAPSEGTLSDGAAAPAGAAGVDDDPDTQSVSVDDLATEHSTRSLPASQIRASLDRARERHGVERDRHAEAARAGGGAAGSAAADSAGTGSLRRPAPSHPPGPGALPTPRREAAARIHVVVPEPVDGGPEQRVVLLREGAHEVGRGEGCRVWLPHLSVSRRHACVRVSPAGIEVEDLGSGNGTWLGAERLVRERVEPGQRIRFGDVVAWFDAI